MGIIFLMKLVNPIVTKIGKWIKTKKESYNSSRAKVTLKTKKYKIKFEIEKITISK
ncbi:hypothetical protein ANS017_22100 [Paraclostridium bifermentans]|nr:hypothetical protein [Paraclostridium bifermentans]EQK49574.1 hypothetical protein C671_0145 [[Clostridium] bifermentans ATCC 19299] [Paraclostridium bifermentans ATCC 19299]MDV8113966.1 hypothetical protein [Bacillus sp. BAU-SS-2023]GKZ03141.1 hypothetical protein ANS014_15750 [Paraclostridium bifermentans]GKZ10826.1 hypothetical protein ANS017_22100 [Paraclostridium bifermentans]